MYFTAMRCIKSNGQVAGLAMFMLVGSGCYHPVTTMFETSESLEAGETKVTLAGTVSPESIHGDYAGTSLTGIVDHGISANQDIRLRVERRNAMSESPVSYSSGQYSLLLDSYSFLELGSKWSASSTANNLAASLPIQLYIPDEGKAFFILDPRVILSTKIADEKMEVSSVFHVQLGGVWGGEEVPGIMPGIALGVGFGKHHATRLEVGWSNETITFGFGRQFRTKKDQDPQL